MQTRRFLKSRVRQGGRQAVEFGPRERLGVVVFPIPQSVIGRAVQLAFQPPLEERYAGFNLAPCNLVALQFRRLVAHLLQG